MNRIQSVVDAVEDAGLFLVDHIVNANYEHELYFETQSGYEADDVDLDEVYDIASQYEAVRVYPAYHQGQDVIVVDVMLK